MAVIKAVSSKAGIGTAIDYVTKEEKTEQTLLSGLNCEPDTAKEEMQATKELWGKTDGRTYKHFVQSFAPDEKIDPVQAHQLACRLAAERPEWKGFEVLVKEHDKVKVHDPLVRLDRAFMKENKVDLTMPMVITSSDYVIELDEYGDKEVSSRVLKVKKK